MMFTNIWYVAEESDTIKDQPVKVKILGRDLVLFRDENGKAVCLSSVCPHRGSDLSMGKCTSDGTISCPFHAWHFDGSGACTKIPSNEDSTGNIPDAARVDSYPTEEKYGYIWVFLGDEIENATPILDIPEYDDPEWRHVTHAVTWNCNQHWAKEADLDHVHLPIVHGIGFGGENPLRPPEHTVELREDGGFETEIIGKPDITSGKWLELRDTRSTVTSVFKYFIPGFTSRGQVAVGGADSGIYNTFYQFTTPIDEENTRMYYTFFRNFMMEPENDLEHLRRNCRNVYQDKSLAEQMMPKRAPDVPTYPQIGGELVDKLIGVYWDLLQDLRSKGWQIDRTELEALDKVGDYRTIPSPARREQGPEKWVYGEVPRVAATKNKQRDVA
ncbi:MAG: aromatic ring-hydroxylating dioxygenase subunit alpha [Gammaproteobacteria bacterium]|nr:aromatic ring-hydroxylating dioxygenase subunit alpha [Gammaproteobacteria bacterium]MCP4088349.1 aromatic ring-hydroxylating dioxygenase subunit alpha [Gammaproteobacteria bacterium]MCP4275113.1 aromatic ring-hydroxylating dioxygenase subunit alpha [Gammaproteobacteria bacterium]MCP4830987.1 aromatic ring-hydroxylating dioxygenase subunit alpha [Gammaproteobacteria bacterium]MCP4927492.1 aromatic ring-hydroxylating dioxygenase subunit alpha [Gammaproteobacteria bacterium]